MQDYKEWWEITKEYRELDLLNSKFSENFSEELSILEYRPK